MRTTRLLVMFVALASIARAYDAEVCCVVQQLRTMREVGGESVGYAGTPHGFYHLYRYCRSASTDKDLQDMLNDESPIVRIMGAKCILSSPMRKIDPKLVDALLVDHAEVVVGPSGCVFTVKTVSDVIRELKRDATFLGK